MLKSKYIIVTSRAWGEESYNKLKIRKGEKWILINSKLNFSSKNLEKIKPKYVFIPHWSYKIPKKIFENFNCIIFHMTDLPYGRGGSPLQNLISRGIYKTKISAIKVEEGIDTGDIYCKDNLKLNGSATDIFKRANSIIQKMIIYIIEKKIKPIPQKGKATIFKRRKPEESNIRNLNSIIKLYDHIRMLDADGYPSAFLENEFFKFEFNEASIINNNEVIAKVKIKKNE